jgi:Ca2+-binding RTX toxin-like protein
MGPGSDSFYFAGTAKDQITLGDGGDKYIDGDNDDHVDAGPGNDLVAGGNFGGGDDVIVGGDGDDNLDGREGNDVIDAGAGDDIVIAYAKGPAAVDCGPGTDTVKIGFNRLVRPNRSCERVTKRFNGRVAWAR